MTLYSCAECRCAECYDVLVEMLNVIMLSVIMLSVVAVALKGGLFHCPNHCVETQLSKQEEI